MNIVAKLKNCSIVGCCCSLLGQQKVERYQSVHSLFSHNMSLSSHISVRIGTQQHTLRERIVKVSVPVAKVPRGSGKLFLTVRPY